MSSLLSAVQLIRVIFTSPFLALQVDEWTSQQLFGVFINEWPVIYEMIEIFHSQLFDKFWITNEKHRRCHLKNSKNSVKKRSFILKFKFNSTFQHRISYFSSGNALYHFATISGNDFRWNRKLSRNVGFELRNPSSSNVLISFWYFLYKITAARMANALR